jgi:hypothetical protein
MSKSINKILIAGIIVVVIIVALLFILPQQTKKFSYTDENISYSFSYPKSYVVDSKTPGHIGAWLTKSDKDGKAICSIYLWLPYTEDAINTKGIENLYNAQLKQWQNMSIDLATKNLGTTNNVNINRMEGTTFEITTGELLHYSYVFKYPSKNLVGYFELVCTSTDSAIVNPAKKEFNSVLKSFN